MNYYNRDIDDRGSLAILRYYHNLYSLFLHYSTIIIAYTSHSSYSSKSY